MIFRTIAPRKFLELDHFNFSWIPLCCICDILWSCSPFYSTPHFDFNVCVFNVNKWQQATSLHLHKMLLCARGPCIVVFCAIFIPSSHYSTFSFYMLFIRCTWQTSSFYLMWNLKGLVKWLSFSQCVLKAIVTGLGCKWHVASHVMWRRWLGCCATLKLRQSQIWRWLDLKTYFWEECHKTWTFIRTVVAFIPS